MLGENILVLSECWNADGTPNKYNARHEAAKLMQLHADRKPWFGLEQEYTLLGVGVPDCQFLDHERANVPQSSPTSRMAGPSMAIPLPRAPTTAVLAAARLS